MSQDAKFTFKILLLGDAAVGKTALVNRFVSGKFRKEYLLTIGMEPYSKYAKIDKTNICYSIWDIAGSQQFTKLRSMFYRGARGALVTFDLTRKESFENAHKWLEDAKTGSANQKFILIGNKNDLEDQRQVSTEEAQAKADELGCMSYIETSALTGEKVEESFEKMGKALLRFERSK